MTETTNYNEYLAKAMTELSDYNEIMFRKIIKMIRLLKSAGFTKDQIYRQLKKDLKPYEDFGDDEILLPLLEREVLV